ncbi:MAG: hypothetical protein A2X23_11365 [Chloroflexi bacterium GWC2_73_18]|nr:MAG: hypothetical protein A2X23_11365 [Chloroflexi bacterium GWC2_73_18]
MLLIVDLDGVVYRGSVPVAGVAEVLRRRAALGDTIVYVTNNSSRHRGDYLTTLAAMDLPVAEERIVTAGRATALRLADGTGPRPRAVMVVGGPGLRRELRDRGFRVVAPTRHGLAARPEAVVVGIDRRLSYGRLAIAARAIREGARFVATNRDPVFPAPEGLLPGAGAVVAALEVAGGRAPEVIGKPEPGLFESAARLAGVAPSSAVVIGDGLSTDIAAAHRIGARSILMLTGVTTPADLDVAPPERHPTAVAADAVELAALLERFAAEPA